MYINKQSAQLLRKAVLSSTVIYIVCGPAFADDTKPILDEIIVTSSILSVTRGENLVGISVLAGEKLQRNMTGSLGETLKFEPGISSSFFGAGASRPIIRGQGGARVLLLDNGIGSIDASSASPDHAASVEPAMASKIEVIRGSGLLRYGSSASGGVVNVIDGRIPERSPDGMFDGSIRLGVSSVDEGYEISAGSDMAIGKLGNGELVAHAEISHRKTGNYNIPKFARSENLRQLSPLLLGGEVRDVLPNSATKAVSLAAGLSYIGAQNFVGFALKDLNSEYGIPSGEGNSIRLDQTRFDISSQIELLTGPFEKVNISGGAADYIHKEREANGSVGTIFTNRGFEGRFEVTGRETDIWRAAHGVQYKIREFTAIGEEAFVPPTTTQLFGIFSFHEWELGALHFEASGRYETVSHKDDTDRSLNFNGVSGSIGADYHITDNLRFGGSAYRTERAPNSEELFSNGPHLATNQFEIGNVNLDKETANGVELSLRYREGGNHLTLNGFYTYYNDYIFELLTGNTVTTDEGDILPISQFTASDAVFKGFELDLGKSIGEWKGFDLAVDASFEYVEAVLRGPIQGFLPRIPPFGVSVGINADGDRWLFRVELDYKSEQNKLAIGELPSDQYALINTFITYDIRDDTVLHLSLHNLTNQEARQHTSFLKENVPLPGRNFKASLTYVF